VISHFLTVLIIVFAGFAAYNGYKLVRYYLDLRANEQAAALAADVFNKATEPPAMPTPTATPTPTTGATETPVPATEAPVVQVVQPGILALREEFKNDDIVGYLSIEGTNIQQVVVQTIDNDFYLRRGIDKQSNQAGTIFMDSSNNPAMTDYNTVLYGHNMRNGSMFHELRYYTSKAFFEDHSIIVYQSLYEETRWEVFAFYPTETEFNYINTVFSTPEKFTDFLAEIRLKSVVASDITVTADDAILTLSTCTSNGDGRRYALHARLIETEE